MKLVVLWTDAVVFLLIAAIWWYALKVARTPHLAVTWRKAFAARTGAATKRNKATRGPRTACASPSSRFSSALSFLRRAQRACFSSHA